VREPLKGGVEGETFYFAVNGVPIYSKGTNMIPLHIFAAKTTAADLKAMVDATVAANMNMIRVWGGGLYPADAFYDACDEAGLLVWQEAMFACAMYPRDPAFLSEVRQEVAHQARRLNYHASMAVWGGNNEVEASLGWYDASRANRELYSNDYTALFVDTVRDALLSVSPSITYLDSSPSKGSVASGPDFYVKRWGDVGDWKRGDVHFYTTTDNALNVSTFPRAKFVSEFGFQSFPSWSVYKGVSEPQDWSYEAPMTVFRQRHPGDTEDMLKQMATHYQVPPAWAPPGAKAGAQATLFQKFIYLTQVYQAATYETASTYWRRIKTAPDAQTMGVLYWQLNDIWPVRGMGERVNGRGMGVDTRAQRAGGACPAPVERKLFPAVWRLASRLPRRAASKPDRPSRKEGGRERERRSTTTPRALFTQNAHVPFPSPRRASPGPPWTTAATGACCTTRSSASSRLSSFPGRWTPPSTGAALPPPP